MARNYKLRTNIVRQLCGFRSGEIARHAPFRSAAVDGKKRNVNCEGAQLFCYAVVSQRVATVVEAPVAESKT